MKTPDLQASLTDLQSRQADIIQQMRDLNSTQEQLIASYSTVNAALATCQYWLDVAMGTTVINDAPNPIDNFNRLVLSMAAVAQPPQ